MLSCVANIEISVNLLARENVVCSLTANRSQDRFELLLVLVLDIFKNPNFQHLSRAQRPTKNYFTAKSYKKPARATKMKVFTLILLLLDFLKPLYKFFSLHHKRKSSTRKFTRAFVPYKNYAKTFDNCRSSKFILSFKEISIF